jgi:hypothetical protein
MAKASVIQTAFTAGVLDPRAASRIDVAQYYQGMSRGDNVVPVPLGGVKRRPGTKYVTQLYGENTSVMGSATASAPNGGVAANAIDDNLATSLTTTTDIGTTDEYVVVEVNLGGEVQFDFVEIRGIRVTSSSSTTFRLQLAGISGGWTTVDTIPIVDGVLRSYRVKVGPITRARMRIIRSGTADMGTARVTLGDITAWSVSETAGSVNLKDFAVSADEPYVIALTERMAQVFDASTGLSQGVFPLPYSDAQVADVDSAQSANALILVHEDRPPQMLEFINGVWNVATVPLENIPQFDFADSLSPAYTNDVQTLTFTDFNEGDTFQISLGGARSGPIEYQGVGDATHQAATAENLRREIQKLWTVGFYGVSVAFTTGTTFSVTFSEDSAANHPVMAGSPLNTQNAQARIAAAKTSNGSTRREPVWSATRGWPRTVTFHEGRLWFGGSRSLPQSIFGSVVNDFFNFEVGSGLDDDGIFITMNTSKLNKIVALFSGRDLQVFTSGGEFRFVTSPITPGNAAPKNQTQYGTAPIKPVSTDGATVFIQKTRKVLRDFLYRYDEDAYSSVPLSVLASFLLDDVIDMASWQGDGQDDANLVMMVNRRGDMIVHVTLRSQEIAAFSRWETQGIYRAVCASEQFRYCAVQRTINGVDRLYLERFDESARLDCALESLPGMPSAFVPEIDGKLVRLRDGNIILDEATVQGGTVQITSDGTPYSGGTVEIGLSFKPVVRTMPLNGNFGNGDFFLRKKRAMKVKVDVFETLGIFINGRLIPDRNYDLNNFDDPPPPFTGLHTIEESSNWEEGHLIQEISQEDPLPFHIRALNIEVESS